VESSDVAPELVLELGNDLRQHFVTVRLADVEETRRERVPLVVGHAVVREVVQRAARVGTESVVVEVVERGAHDPALRQQTRLRKVEQPGQELAPGQIAGGAEQHHDVRTQRRDQARIDVGGLGTHLTLIGARGGT
jgi:hypothetical protein